MKITPAASETDRRVKVYNFIEAVKSFTTNFTQSETDFIFQKINPKWCGTLRSIFICLSDDEYRSRKLKGKPAESSSGEQADPAGPVDPSDPPVPDGTVEPIETDDTRSEVSARSTVSSRSGRSEKSRSHKRGASSTPDGGAAAKR